MGAGVVVAAIALALLLGRKLFELPPSLASLPFGLAIVALLSLAALFAYWTYGCFSLRYELRGGYLRVTWGPNRLFIPLSQITALVMGSRVMERPQVAGVSWPGYAVGPGWTSKTGPTIYLATSQASIDLVYLQTPQGAYAISAPDLSQFTHHLEARLKEDHSDGAATIVERWPVLDLGAWKDRLFLGLALVSVAFNLGLWIHTLYSLPALPPLLALHFDILGRVDRIGLREDVLRFPLAALGVILMNTLLGVVLHQRESLAARLVVGLAALIQVIIWVALGQVVTY